MLCEITVESGYLKAELFNRQTAGETNDALVTIAAEARRHRCWQILVSVHASRPIFKIEQSGVLDRLRALGETSKCRVALTADTEELRLSHEYLVSVAQRAGINVRSFTNQQAALDWVRDRRWLLDRRVRNQPWVAHERRQRRPRRSSDQPFQYA